MKKTAVEWFEQQLDDLDIEIPFSIFEQAKEMEKSQIIDARVKKILDSEYKEAEQYYNETFNK
jgi:hypothetical protein